MTMRRRLDPEELFGAAADGDRRALARAISMVEAGGDAADDLMSHVRISADGAWRVGLTGPPGAGKSTLTATLAETLAGEDCKVAVLAVDPSSPFTGGAVLGDRVRMARCAAGTNVYVRSMASRGATGGLSDAAADAVDLLDASGFDVVLVETVGVGQQDVDIHSVVDTTVVLVVPESGDHIQTIKAGILEAGDVYVVNKIDRPGAGAMLAALQGSLTHQHRRDLAWEPPVIGVSALEGAGLPSLLEAIQWHRQHLQTRGPDRHARLQARLRQTLVSLLREDLAARLPNEVFSGRLQRVADGEASVRQAARDLLREYRSRV